MKPTILLVDNDPKLVESRFRVLADAGYNVITAATKREALEKLDEHLVHVAIIDIRLVEEQDRTERTGLDLCHTISSYVPCIIATAYPEWEAVREALARVDERPPAARAFLKKPEGPEVLLREIDRVIRSEYDVIPSRRIAVATSGGDSPGMNAAVWAVLRSALSQGIEVYAVYDGYQGMIDDDIRKLRWHDVADSLVTSGTMLGTARSKEFKDFPDKRETAARNLMKRHITGLIVIGGDGSMTGAEVLAGVVEKNHASLQTIGLPGTIDNDLEGSDMSIGAASAVTAVIHEINNMIAPARALRRVFVCEIMGRYSGFVTIEAGLCVGADAILLPEELVVLIDESKGNGPEWRDNVDVPRTVRNVEDRIDLVAEQLHQVFRRGKRHAFVLFSEGIRLLTTVDKKERLNAEMVADRIQERIRRWPDRRKPDVRHQVIGYPMRGVPPTRYDVRLGTLLGQAAVESYVAGESNIMLGWKDREGIVKTHFRDVVRQSNRAPAVKYAERDRWKELVEMQRRFVDQPPLTLT